MAVDMAGKVKKAQQPDWTERVFVETAMTTQRTRDEGLRALNAASEYFAKEGVKTEIALVLAKIRENTPIQMTFAKVEKYA